MTRDDKRRNQQLTQVDPITDGVILALWRAGYDTVAIARHVKVSECQVYNRILHVREAARV